MVTWKRKRNRKEAKKTWLDLSFPLFPSPPNRNQKMKGWTGPSSLCRPQKSEAIWVSIGLSPSFLPSLSRAGPWCGYGIFLPSSLTVGFHLPPKKGLGDCQAKCTLVQASKRPCNILKSVVFAWNRLPRSCLPVLVHAVGLEKKKQARKAGTIAPSLTTKPWSAKPENRFESRQKQANTFAQSTSKNLASKRKGQRKRNRKKKQKNNMKEIRFQASKKGKKNKWKRKQTHGHTISDKNHHKQSTRQAKNWRFGATKSLCERWDARPLAERWGRLEKTCRCAQWKVLQRTTLDVGMTTTFWDTNVCNWELCTLEPRVFAWWVNMHVSGLCGWIARAQTWHVRGVFVHIPRRLSEGYLPTSRKWS